MANFIEIVDLKWFTYYEHGNFILAFAVSKNQREIPEIHWSSSLAEDEDTQE